MADNKLPLLSQEFKKSIGSRFFLPLADAWRDVAIDILDRIAPEFSRGRRTLPRYEVISLIEDVIITHPQVVFPIANATGETTQESQPNLSDWNTPGYRANYYFRQLSNAGWLIEDEFRYNLRQVTVSLDSNAHALLALLRDMGSSSLSTSTRFSDTFRSVINTLLDEQRPPFAEHDDSPYATLRDMIDRCSKGMVVLRRIENIFRRIIREQTETQSRRRNLELVVDELSQLTRSQYYQELQNPFLYAHCDKAVARLDEVSFEFTIIRRMAGECLSRGEASDEAGAEARVREGITELSELLSGLRGDAQQIEKWARRFLDASLAKFQHLQSLPSRQVENARVCIEKIAVEIAGEKWWLNLPVEKLPPCRLPEFGFIWGRSSLYTPRTLKPKFKASPIKRAKPVLDDAVVAQMRATRRKALTIKRACNFIKRIISEPGGSITSAQLKLNNLDELLNIVACICYASSSKVNYKIEHTRPGTSEGRYVSAGKWLLDHFIITRIR